MIWMETSTPDLAEAKEFADAIHAKYPGKLLAYNCSPSFNWKRHLNDAAIAEYQKVLLPSPLLPPSAVLTTYMSPFTTYSRKGKNLSVIFNRPMMHFASDVNQLVLGGWYVLSLSEKRVLVFLQE